MPEFQLCFQFCLLFPRPLESQEQICVASSSFLATLSHFTTWKLFTHANQTYLQCLLNTPVMIYKDPIDSIFIFLFCPYLLVVFSTVVLTSLFHSVVFLANLSEQTRGEFRVYLQREEEWGCPKDYSHWKLSCAFILIQLPLFIGS